MYPLLILSLTAVAVIVERFLAYRTIAFEAPGLLKEIIDLCRRNEFEKATQRAESQPGPVASCLAAVLRHRELAVEDLERNVQEVGEQYFIELERRLPVLDTTTTISPLLGLLGTLFGMISTFREIGAAKSQGATDSILAGVGEALYATATGLTIAVVCFIAYNYFASRSRAVSSETEQSATKLINTLRELRRLGEPQEA